MKKQTLILAAILLIAATTITIASCKKDKPEEKVVDKEFFVENDQTENMDEYLLAFKQKMLTAQKGNEILELEEAQRDLTNLFNFAFGDANYATNTIRHDTLFAKLPIVEGKVDLYQLKNTYQSLYEQIVETYKKIDLPEKSIYYIVCSFDRTCLEDEANITTIIATRSMDNNRTNYMDWRAGSGAGTCDGLLVGWYGAPEEINGMLNSINQSISCENGGRVYFTDERADYKSALHDDMLDSNSPCGRRLLYLYNSDPTVLLENTCITHSQIIYYYNQARYLPITHYATFYPNPIPTNHVVLEYYMYSLKSPYSPAGTSLWWNLLVTHAKPNCTEVLPDV